MRRLHLPEVGRTLAFDPSDGGPTHWPRFIHIGHLRVAHPWEFGIHRHDEYEIIRVERGRVRYWIDGMPRDAGPGTCYAVLPGQTHREEALPGGQLSFHFLKFDWRTAQGNRVHLFDPARPVAFRMPDRQGRVGDLFRRIHAEVLRPRLGSTDLVHALVLEMICHLRRHWESPPPSAGANPGRISTYHRRVVAQARSYLDQNLKRTVSLEELGDYCALSPTYAWHVFKEVEGVSPLRYSIRQRMEEARRLMMDSRHTIAEAAQAVGYDDAGYFSRLFRKITGLTPREFRRQSGSV